MILLHTFMKLPISQTRIGRSSLDYWVLLFLLGCFGCYSVYLGQDVNWDLKNYHWYNPYAFLHDRMNFDLAPAQLQTYYNPLLDVLFYLFTTWIDYPLLISFLMGSIHAFGIFFLYKIIDTLLPRSYPYRTHYLILSILVGATGTAALPVVGATFYDSHLSAFVLCSLYLAVKAVVDDNEKPTRRLVALSGLLAGTATGLKLPYGVYAVALCLALLTYRATLKKSFGSAFLFGVSVLAGVLASDGFWIWRIYHKFQNPFFPYFNDIFRSEYAEYVGIHGYPFGPQNIFMGLFFPFYIVRKNVMLVSELPLCDWRLAVVMLLTMAVVIMGMYRFGRGLSLNPERVLYERQFGWRILLVFSFVGYALWLGLYSAYRYFIPIEMLTGLLIVYFCWILFRNGLLRLGAVSVFAILVMFTASYPNWGRIKFGKRYFNVEIPLLPKNPLVIISTLEPLAYLIPFMNADARFVRPESNFTFLTHQNRLQKEIAEVIRTHQGPLFLLENRAQERKIGDNILSYYQLYRNEQACAVIRSNIDQDNIQLCSLERVTSQAETDKHPAATTEAQEKKG